MTGAELRGYRKAVRLSQKALGQRADISPSTVKYWERKAWIDPNGWAVKRIAEALGIGSLMLFLRENARAGGRGFTGWDQICAQLDAEVEAKMAASRERATLRVARRRVVCGAKTRKDAPCRNLSEPGKRRCKFHGGKSTGPKTAEGKSKIADAQRLRWAKWLGKRP